MINELESSGLIITFLSLLTLASQVQNTISSITGMELELIIFISIMGIIFGIFLFVDGFRKNRTST